MELDGGNIFSALTGSSADEVFTELLALPHIKIERIVSTGQATKPGTWLDEARAEWVLLVSGAAALLFEGEETPREMRPGDYLLIPPHKRHRVERTAANEPTVWLAVHFDL